MPAPPGPVMKGLVIAKMGPKTTGSPPFDKFLTALMGEISDKWAAWIKDTKWGGLTVAGAGIGAWAGVGNGGKISAPPYSFSVDAVFSKAGFTVQTPGTKKFLTTLNELLGQKFDGWASSFKFVGTPFVGTSTATPVSPGTFTAQNTPMPLIALGTGTLPSGIQSAWEAKLSSSPEPVFALDNPNCYTKLFTGAVASTIEAQFAQFFLVSTLGSSNSATGAATPGAGAGSASSQNNGKII